MPGNYRTQNKTSSYRDALYATLEAAVREDTKDSAIRGGIINNYHEEHVNCATACVEYPSPFLWYEEMTPADVDAYHASHVNVHRGDSDHCGSSNQSKSSSAVNTNSCPDEAVSPSNHAYRETHLRAHGVLRNAVAVQGLVEAERETTRMQTSEQASSPSSISARQSSESSEADDASNSLPSHSPQRVAGVIKTRRVSLEDKEPVMEQQLPHRECVDASAGDARSRRFLVGALSCGGVESATALTATWAMPSPPICQKREPTASSKDCPPTIKSSQSVASDASVRTSTVSIDQSVAAFMRPSSSQKPRASQCTPTPNDGGGKEAEDRAETASTHHHVVDCRSKQETWPTTTPCTQSTQQSMLFLPGLPSQVLVTQQRGDAGWDHDQHAVEEEEEAPMSEYGLSLSVNHYYRDPLPPDVSGQEGRGGCDLVEEEGTCEGRGKKSQEGTGDCMDVDSEGGRGGSAPFPARQQEAHTRQHEAFTRALGALFGSGEACPGGTSKNVAVGSAATQCSLRARDEQQPRKHQQQFVFVSTEEVLPSGYLGGQAGVCALLEDHLLRARKLAPDGYAARTLELACHVLRQPKVCVRAERAQASVDRMLRNMDSTEAVVDDHAEVVGVAGFVWEILRTN